MDSPQVFSFLPFESIYVGCSLSESATHMGDGLFCLSQSFLELPSQIQPEVYLTNLLGDSKSIQVGKERAGEGEAGATEMS